MDMFGKRCKPERKRCLLTEDKLDDSETKSISFDELAKVIENFARRSQQCVAAMNVSLISTNSGTFNLNIMKVPEIRACDSRQPIYWFAKTGFCERPSSPN